MSDVERFIERFSEFWAAPEPQRFRDLFTDDGRLRHPGMKEYLPAERVPEYVQGIKAACPDIHLVVDRWAAGEDFVLIEWTLRGTFGGQQHEHSGVDRFTLRGDRAVEGIAYFDTLPLWAVLDPSMTRDVTLERAAAQVVATS